MCKRSLDEESREEKEMKRIMKKMFVGKRLAEDTESEKRRKKRMQEATERNRLKDLLLGGEEGEGLKE